MEQRNIYNMPWYYYRYSFVEHHATYLHFDFRIDLGGRALSFAISEGPSLRPGLSSLAVEMPLHSVKSMFSETTIPEGFYGAGERRVWDRGLLKTDVDILTALQSGCVFFSLDGSILKGKFKFEILSNNDREWELTKLEDEFADPNFVLVPILKDQSKSATQLQK
jgi:bifunctional non-homologous end joining protein LigD